MEGGHNLSGIAYSKYPARNVIPLKLLTNVKILPCIVKSTLAPFYFLVSLGTASEENWTRSFKNKQINKQIQTKATQKETQQQTTTLLLN